MISSLRLAWAGRHRTTNALRSATAWLLLEGRGTVHVLRWIGVLLVLWYERLTFLWASLRCIPPWRTITTTPQALASATSTSTHAQRNNTLAPDRDDPTERRRTLSRRAPIGAFFGNLPSKVAGTAEESTVTTMHISILADPQLVDRQSYSHLSRLPYGLNHIAYAAVRWASDTYARKSYDAVVRTRGRAQNDAVVWLGDLLDGGRSALHTNVDVESYERHVARFRKTFKQRVPSVYVPGNHDIRIPLTNNPVFNSESVDSRQRWLQTWGTWYDRTHARFAWSRYDDTRTVTTAVDAATNGDVKGSAQGPISTIIPSSARKVVLLPPGGPRQVIIESNAWQRTINARFPLHLDINSTFDTPTHEIVLINALDMAGMAPAYTTSDTQSTSKWRQTAEQKFTETLAFVDGLQDAGKTYRPGRQHTKRNDAGSSSSPPMRILFSHIPLWRSPDASCTFDAGSGNAKTATPSYDVAVVDRGWHRERSGQIDQGVDQYATYQNMLAQPVSEWLLERTRPSLIYSGDNHDHCHIAHAIPGHQDQPAAHELTLKAFSMTGGVRRPGYARLTLTYDALTGRAGAITMPCVLPDQVAIWTQAYPVVLVLLFGLLWSDRRWRFGARFDQTVRDQSVLWHERWQGHSPLHAWQRQRRRGRDEASEPGVRDDGDDNDEDDDAGNGMGLQSIRAHQHRVGPSSQPRFGGDSSPRKAGRKGRLQEDEDPPSSSVPHSATAFHEQAPRHDVMMSPLRFHRRDRQNTQFEQRARRELRKASLAGQAVPVERRASKEVMRMLLLPILFWIGLQL